MAPMSDPQTEHTVAPFPLNETVVLRCRYGYQPDEKRTGSRIPGQPAAAVVDVPHGTRQRHGLRWKRSTASTRQKLEEQPEALRFD